jgi:hypothetical protein
MIGHSLRGISIRRISGEYVDLDAITISQAEGGGLQSREISRPQQ